MSAWNSFVSGLYTLAEHWKLVLFIVSVATAVTALVTRRITRALVKKNVFMNTVNIWALLRGEHGFDFVTMGGNETLANIYPGADYDDLRKAIIVECKRERKAGDDGILHLPDGAQHILMMSGVCRRLSGNNVGAVDAAILGVGHVAEFATVVTFKATNDDTVIDIFKIDARQLAVLADPMARAAVGVAHPRHREVIELLGVAARKATCSYSNKDFNIRAGASVWKFIDTIDADTARKCKESPHAAA